MQVLALALPAKGTRLRLLGIAGKAIEMGGALGRGTYDALIANLMRDWSCLADGCGGQVVPMRPSRSVTQEYCIAVASAAEGKNGVRIDKAKYETMRAAILEVLAEGPCAFTPMTERIAQKLEGSFSGSISWYAVTVKQDLEARGVIRPLPGTKPVKLAWERDKASTAMRLSSSTSVKVPV